VAHLVRPDGARLYYELHGPAGGAPLLLLEGIGANVAGWRDSLSRLSERRRLIAYDFRGNGRSDQTDRELPIALLAADSLALLDHLEVGSAHVYGQSLGGMVAIEMALTHPGRARSLVLAATHAGHAGAFHRLSWKVPKTKPFVMLYSRSFLQRHPERVARDLRAVQESPSAPGLQRRHWEAIFDFDAWDRVPRITQPTLILHGTDDRIVPVENARRLAELIPRAELHLLERAGHVYHWEQPEEADRAVIRFLDRVEAAR
jgi:pimeloyl-ACP methyl ester carboxylesterase